MNGEQKRDSRKLHWEQIYNTKPPTEVSWYQTYPSLSIKLINATGIKKEENIIDVGGGASLLVDYLLDSSFTKLAVLDISHAAIKLAKHRLGKRANNVEWFEADVTEFQSPHKFELWHDRAVFHFLTDEEDRKRYMRVLKDTMTPSGHLIIATFAIDGPKKCSGLDVVRYDAKSLSAQVGSEFELLEEIDETHMTPANVEQKFTYFRFKRLSNLMSATHSL